MAKMNKKALLSLCDSINKKQGDGTVYTLDSKYANLNIPRWSTGIEDLDAIIGGGMPEGRVIEIYGGEGSGKTTLLHHLTSLHEMALNIPIEGTFDASRAKVFGNHKGQLIVFRARYGEEAFNKVIKFSQAGIPIIGVDSVPSMIPKEDAEKVLKAADKDSIENQRIGGVARLMTQYLPSVEEVIELTGTTLIFVNQIRDKMNAMAFGEQTQTMGGHKLKHACSLRLQVARKKWIEIPNKDPRSTAENEKVGFIQKVKIVKSKVCNPLGECELACFFDRGYVSFDEIADIRKELMEQRRQQYSKKKVKEVEIDEDTGEVIDNEEWEDDEVKEEKPKKTTTKKKTTKKKTTTKKATTKKKEK